VTYGEYEVTGNREYRGHAKGTRFEAKHDAAKARAIARGNIRLLRLITPSAPTTGSLPADWPPSQVPPQANREAPDGDLVST
jgi:hypothetical protein